MDRDRPEEPQEQQQAEAGAARSIGGELLEEVAALWVELAPHTFGLFFHVVPHCHPLLVKMLEQTMRTPERLAKLTRWIRPPRRPR